MSFVLILFVCERKSWYNNTMFIKSVFIRMLNVSNYELWIFLSYWNSILTQLIAIKAKKLENFLQIIMAQAI